MSDPDQPLPPAHRSIASTARLIARSDSRQSRSLRNRLLSIAEDARFVAATAERLGLPLVANERCGRWYVQDGSDGGNSAYFKSTDGHHGTWGFSLRRLNLGVLECVGGAGGCIVVDSTRRGKHLPDALSKTIPIWCAVMNRLLFPDITESHGLVTLPALVSASEYEQITGCLDGFVAQAKHTLDLDFGELRTKVQKPLYPLWLARSLFLTAATVTLPEQVKTGEFYPVYLCMASVFQPDATASLERNFEYVQGAGDDAESWAHGLNPSLFWQHFDELLGAEENELPNLIAMLCSDSHIKKMPATRGLTIPGSPIMVADMDQGMKNFASNDIAVICSPELPSGYGESDLPRLLHLKCGVGKLGSRDLRKELPRVPGFIADREFEKILICCTDGRDISIGVALVILVLFSHESGAVSSKLNEGIMIDKTLIRKKLSKIVASLPSANPSRATLNAVNAFLMKEPS